MKSNGPPWTEVLQDYRSNFKNDFLSSVVVFLVALPLCMGIAIASGVPVAAGLITGIVGGLVVALLAGCPLQVSGPAAGLAVVVVDLIQRIGIEMLGVVVLLAGVLQIGAGLLGLGRWFRAVSPAVVHGMLAGIGILILGAQFHVMVDDKPKGDGLTNLLTIPSAIQKGISTIPQLGDPETRKLQTRLLREIGELHRQQVELAEHVAEQSPLHGIEGEKASLLADKVPEEQRDLEESAATQLEIEKQLRFELGELRLLLDQPESRMAGSSVKQVRVQSAAKDALAKSDAALAALHAGGILAATHAQHEAVTALEGLLDSLKNHNFAAEIGVLTITILLLWQGLAPKRLKLVPAPLLAVIIATGVAAALSLPVLYVEAPSNLFSQTLHFPTWSGILSEWEVVLEFVIVMAIVASAETLLSATAVDQLHDGPRTRYDRELFAQGVGNMICGALGSLPMTGVIVRSSANVAAGAKTRMSAWMHGVWLLLFVSALAFLLRMIPTSCLAAILVYTGYKLVNVKALIELRKYGRGEVVVYLATVFMIVAVDLLTGVLVGVGLAAAKLLFKFSKLDADLRTSETGEPAVLQLSGAATFIRLPKLAEKLESVPPGAELHVNLDRLDYIDHACLELLMNWSRQQEATGGKVVIDWNDLRDKFRTNRRAQAKKPLTPPWDAPEPDPSHGSSGDSELHPEGANHPTN
ncbi:SulP family inorganic anion transporter [Lignipirellula cremea]|uniref:C4-dicarboxylic acid transporter DauA n=1 Tax=Lignipirellula cremea TaxID=2528010 RepID=A0A518DSX1_9BACT|nr:SulP family inorganic anion transporter [Lignipirellula cremea]QDU94924.1 C4-dicarboxylic acid transporter DauA [Lignipirellula cremea]